MASLLDNLTRTRLRGRAATVATVVRIVSGLAFVLFSLGKFIAHEQYIASFASYGLPASSVLVYLVGLLELVGGLLLVVGFATRPVAVALALNMLGAILTAGLVEGGLIHLGLAPTLLVLMLFLGWAGPGPPALDHLLVRSTGRAVRP